MITTSTIRSDGRRAPPAPAGTEPVEAIPTAISRSSRAARPISARRRELMPGAAQPSTLHRLVRRPPLAECWPRPVGDGRRQRHAGQLLGRRREPRPGGCGRDGAAAPRRGGGSGRRRRRVDAPGRGRRLRRGGAPARAAGAGAGSPASRSRSTRRRPRWRAPGARRAASLLVNDVTALRGDPELAGAIADAGAYVCLMHMQGEPRTMQVAPRYDDVVGGGRRRFSRSGSPSPWRPGFPRTTSASTRGSGSARRPTRTSS